MIFETIVGKASGALFKMNVVGREAEEQWLTSIINRKQLLYDASDFVFNTKGRWKTDDLVINPEKFLEHLNDGGFGKTSGLTL